MVLLTLFTTTVALCVTFIPNILQVEAVDLTTIPETSGKEVVQIVISRIQNTRIFSFDHQLIRRIACVESSDGTDSSTYRKAYHGGIWQVDEEKFMVTQNDQNLPKKYDQILETFDIEWLSVTWEDLRKPLYSGLAVFLYLSTIEEEIPPASNVDNQTRYWRQHYNSGGTAADFEGCITQVSNMAECRIKSDIVFVLDSSGSIGSTNYNRMLNFVRIFVNGLTIGENTDRVGIIIYSDRAQQHFNLNTYLNNQEALHNAITDIPYLNSMTNTPDGLCLLVNSGFTAAAGARVQSSSVFRIAMVITDGRSNENENQCGYNDVIDAAESVHEVEPLIQVYAIGVGDYVLEELEAIATSPDFVVTLDTFDKLLRALEERQYEICFEVSQPTEVGNATNKGELDQGEQARFKITVGEDEAIEIKICALNGAVVAYTSTEIPNPNEAFHDTKIEVATGCNSVKHKPTITKLAVVSDSGSVMHKPVVNKRQQRHTIMKHKKEESDHSTKDNPNERESSGNMHDTDVNQTVTLHIAIEGTNDSNVFTLKLEETDIEFEGVWHSDEIAWMVLLSIIALIICCCF